MEKIIDTKQMVDKYFVVFRINFNTEEGEMLRAVMDLDLADSHSHGFHIRGYATKTLMKRKIVEFENGFLEYRMLKPIS